MHAHRHAVIFLSLLFFGWLTILAPRAWGQLPTLDAYGGREDITCSGGAKGYFYTQKVGSHWYFCDALGNAFISMSVANVIVNNNPTYDALGVNTYPIYATKYASTGDSSGTTYNWAWQTLKRMQSWSFNTTGQDSGYTLAYETCSGCTWPGTNPKPIPIKIPYIAESKPAEHAAYNANGYVTSPVKDMIAGTNTNGNSLYRGGSTYDFFDPSISTEWTNELAASTTGSEAIRANSPYILFVLTDDSDYFLGTGAGPDFPANGDGATNGNAAWVTLITSPVQTYNRSTAIGSVAILYPNTIVYAKAQATNPVTACSISNPCSLRDYLWQKYSGSISALNAAWESNYTTFDSTGTQVTGETIGIGDGSTTTFTYTLAHTPVSPYSVQIFVGGTFKIGDCPQFHSGCGSTSGSGELESPTSGYVTSSTINYSTGAIT
ncbi:MAG: hypothetical protein WBD87_02965, partial [Candidatus Acidiferrales bacterium]